MWSKPIKLSSEVLSCVSPRRVRPHLGHLALTVSGQERHVVDLVHHHKVLLLPLKVLLGEKGGLKGSYAIPE